MVRYFPERMGTLLGLVFLDTNHSEEVPCVHLYQSPKLGTTVIGHSSRCLAAVRRTARFCEPAAKRTALPCAIDPLGGRPTGDHHVLVVDAGVPLGPKSQGMFQIALVIALGKIGALVRAARFLTGQGAERHRLSGDDQRY